MDLKFFSLPHNNLVSLPVIGNLKIACTREGKDNLILGLFFVDNPIFGMKNKAKNSSCNFNKLLIKKMKIV